MKLSSFLPTLALSLLLTGVAAAQPSTADRASARELGKEGEAALARKDFTTAADRYARAEAMFHAPTLLLGLARAQVGLGKMVDAQESYRRIISEPVAANAPPAFAEAVTSARTEMAAVTPRIAWITITVSGVDAPTIKLDDQVLPPAALGARRAVDPGPHVIVAMVQGNVVKRTTIKMSEGGSETVPLVLTAPVGGDAAPSASSDGSKLQPTPTSQDSAPASKSPRKTVGFVSLGVGGAGILLGAVTGAVVISQHGPLATDCPGGTCSPKFDSKLSGYNTMGLVSTVGFIGGGALAALGTVLVVTAPKSGTTVGLSVSPIAGGGAFGAKGSF